MRKQDNYLRSFRKKLGFTQADLATIIGAKSGASVSKQETSRRLPTFLEALTYELIFGKAIKDIFSGECEGVKGSTKKRIAELKAKLDKEPESRANEYKRKMTNLIIERI